MRKSSLQIWGAVAAVWVSSSFVESVWSADAERTSSPPESPESLESPSDSGQPVQGQKKRTKGKRVGEKETEGTQAPNRFQADTVIKSPYRLNGEQLEVDPD